MIEMFPYLVIFFSVCSIIGYFYSKAKEHEKTKDKTATVQYKLDTIRSKYAPGDCLFIDTYVSASPRGWDTINSFYVYLAIKDDMILCKLCDEVRCSTSGNTPELVTKKNHWIKNARFAIDTAEPIIEISALSTHINLTLAARREKEHQAQLQAYAQAFKELTPIPPIELDHHDRSNIAPRNHSVSNPSN